MIKEQIGELMRAIDTQGGATREKEVVKNLVASAAKYIDIVVRQGVTIQAEKDQEMLASIDQNRSRVHDSLISQIAIVNRLCAKYGITEIYQGADERRAKGDFAMELITSYFLDRI